MLAPTHCPISEDTEMKPATRATPYLAAIMLFAVSGCGGGSGESADTAAVDEDSAEFAAMQYRQGLMQVLAFKGTIVRDMAEGTMEADAALFAESAADAAAVAGMIVEGFQGLEASSTDALPGTAALPDIWNNWDDFMQKAADLAAGADAVSAAANEPGFAVMADSAEPLVTACGNCHRSYRQL